MGCGLRKLEDPDDSSPGKIFSTLKRPQVETKADSAYEYVLLDFTLEGSSNPDVIKISTVLDIAKKVEEYYTRGYVVGAIHPVLLSVGRRRRFPASHMYRVVLSRLKISQKHPQSRGQRYPRLVIEECSLTYEKLTNEAVKGLLEKINDAAKRGMKFVGFITQPCPQSKICNGTDVEGNVESDSELCRRSREQRRQNSDENVKTSNEGTLSGQSSESGTEEEIHPEGGLLQDTDFQDGREGSPGPTKLRKEDDKLYTVFNVFEDDSTCWTYHDGILSLKVARKGSVINTLDADWLELTSFYYKQGLALIDSFVCWEASKSDYLPKALEGVFIYEEEGSGVPGSNRKGNDAIVVEQWTVIEGSEIKTDYGPLLHTLAEFGWLLTCVLPTPIIRLDSEGNLATKQVVFLQRPVMWSPAAQTPERRTNRQVREEKGKVSNRSVGLDTATSPPAQNLHPTDEFHLSSPTQCWDKDGSFPGFSRSDDMLKELDDGQFDQEDGVTQVTCM
ncbi:raftlin-2 [Anolis carolinensis]|uniref:raftlin-2 n=1 Tax=Anolis carolinensis TaxID=28377 RepID=UPI0007DB733D|nr:PREDICTED: raftlin-2 [Anolis carolinensis]|eukprot:XP_008118276.2 PREDICTED: raftlin-2 [Anolis carolinensis]